MKVIYSIVNLANGKLYIGSTSNFSRRKNIHLRLLRKRKHHSVALQNAWNKYGEESFSFIILKKLSPDEDIKKEEQSYLDKYQPFNRTKGYNISKESYIVKLDYEPVIQISLTGEVVAEHASCVEAAQKVDCDGSGLSKCARNKYRYYAGFVWIYKKDFTEDTLKQRVYLANNRPSFSEERRRKMSNRAKQRKYDSIKYKKVSEALKGRIPKNLSDIQLKRRKPVYVYDSELNLVDFFETKQECLDKYPGACKWLSSKPPKKTKSGYIFSFTPRVK